MYVNVSSSGYTHADGGDGIHKHLFSTGSEKSLFNKRQSYSIQVRFPEYLRIII